MATQTTKQELERELEQHRAWQRDLLRDGLVLSPDEVRVLARADALLGGFIQGELSHASDELQNYANSAETPAERALFDEASHLLDTITTVIAESEDEGVEA